MLLVYHNLIYKAIVFLLFKFLFFIAFSVMINKYNLGDKPVSTDRKFHIAALSGQEQLVLKLLLKNMLKHKTKEIMSDPKENLDKYLIPEVKFKEFTRLFNTYDDLTSSLPNYQNLDKARTKLFYFTHNGISFMMDAFTVYKNNYKYGLDLEDINIIENSFEQMEALLNESKEFSFTADEINKAYKMF